MFASRLRDATVACPCCGYPTLTEPAAYEICVICWWEDDGQGEAAADEVWGGPNGTVSLFAARANFRDHLTMYPPGGDTRVGRPDTKSEVSAKRSMIEAYERLRSALIPAEREAARAAILEAEAVLNAETHSKVRELEDGQRGSDGP